jgi:hypothetical protein
VGICFLGLANIRERHVTPSEISPTIRIGAGSIMNSISSIMEYVKNLIRIDLNESIMTLLYVYRLFFSTLTAFQNFYYIVCFHSRELHQSGYNGVLSKSLSKSLRTFSGLLRANVRVVYCAINVHNILQKLR